MWCLQVALQAWGSWWCGLMQSRVTVPIQRLSPWKHPPSVLYHRKSIFKHAFLNARHVIWIEGVNCDGVFALTAAALWSKRFTHFSLRKPLAMEQPPKEFLWSRLFQKKSLHYNNLDVLCLRVLERDRLWHLKHTASKHMSFHFLLQANQFRQRRACTVAIYWSDLQRITRATFPVCLCTSLTQKRDQKAHRRSDQHVLKRLIVFCFLRKTERRGACVRLKHQPAPIRPRWNAVIRGGVNGLCH